MKFHLGEVHGAEGKQLRDEGYITYGKRNNSESEEGEIKVLGKNGAKIAQRIAYLLNTYGI